MKHRDDLLKNGMTRRVLEYKRHLGWACTDANASADADAYIVNGLSSDKECWARCDVDLDCGCAEYTRADGTCNITIPYEKGDDRRNL